MQITLEQAEIESAVKDYVKNLGMGFAKDPKITFTAGRGTAGLTAGIELTLAMADTVVPLGPGEVTELASKPKVNLEAFAPTPEPAKAPTAKPAPEKKTKPAAPKKAPEPIKEDLVEEEPADPFAAVDEKPAPKEVATTAPISGSESLFGTGSDNDEVTEESDDLIEEEETPPSEMTADALFAS